MIKISSKNEVENYYKSDRLSQSDLKSLIKGIDSYLYQKSKKNKDFSDIEKENLIIGSAVDCILTGNKEDYEDKYYCSKLQYKPSDAMILIVKKVFNDVCIDNLYESTGELKDNFEEILLDLDIKDFPDYVLEAVNFYDYSSNWLEQTRIKKVFEHYLYFEELKKGYNKQILSIEEDDKINQIVKSLKESKVTQKYFDRDFQDSCKNTEFYYQYPIYFTYKGIECKALLDLVIVSKDMSGNIIKVEPIDLKTTSGRVLDFINAVHKFRYDIQASWYIEALSQHFNIPKSKIGPFKFIVESTTHTNKPLVFVCLSSLLEIGQKGRPEIILSNSIIKKEILGYEQLTDLYLYHQKTGWEEEKIIADNNGYIRLNWEKYY